MLLATKQEPREVSGPLLSLPLELAFSASEPFPARPSKAGQLRRWSFSLTWAEGLLCVSLGEACPPGRCSQPASQPARPAPFPFQL